MAEQCYSRGITQLLGTLGMPALSWEDGALLFVLALAAISILAPPLLSAFGIGQPPGAADDPVQMTYTYANEDEPSGLINPASGLPMRDSMFDVAGNSFGSAGSASSDED